MWLYVVALRAVTAIDGMTADFYPFDGTFMGTVATRIVNEVKGVNRLVYDVTSKAAYISRICAGARLVNGHTIGPGSFDALLGQLGWTMQLQRTYCGIGD
jgi:hypothetical protein